MKMACIKRPHSVGKLKNKAEIKRISSRLRKKAKHIVFTNGCFDILHYGHVKYLEKCKALGDVLVVGLNSDASVKALKGKGRPLNRQRERALVLSALGCVDYVVTFGERTPLKLIEAVRPHVLAKGGDWKKDRIIGSGFVKENGGKVISVPFVRGFSTTGIMKKLRKA